MGRIRGALSPSTVVGRTPSIHEPRLLDGVTYWLEQRPQEGGRTTLMAQAPGSPEPDECTPGPWNLRSRVHEYGGGAYCVGHPSHAASAAAVAVFVDDGDPCLWRLDLGGKTPGTPVRLTEPAARSFADGLIDPWQQRWIGVLEQDGRDALVAVPLAGGEPELLHRCADFCGYAVLSPRGSHLAWVAWQQPFMPWQRSELWLGRFDGSGSLEACRAMAGSGPQLDQTRSDQASSDQPSSVFQPLWIDRPQGAALVVANDRSGWWNLELLAGAENLSAAQLTPAASPPAQAAPWEALLPMAAEFAMPQWVYGMRTTAWDGAQLVAAACREGRWQLGQITLPTPSDSACTDSPAPEQAGRWQPLALPFDDLAGLDAEAGRLVAVASSPTTLPGLLSVELASGSWRHQPAAAGPLPLRLEAISRPEPLWFEGYGGLPSHAWYYPPAGGGHAQAPLLVKGHSGPTGMARTGLNLAIQYWTSRGWGVVDVNYGGSTGFGRAYRERLDGQWGVVDVADCAAAAGALVAAGRASAARIAIEGGSAGGFTALAALCFSDTFGAAACRYAVADPGALAAESHRFEARYLDSLIGPWPEAQATYAARSPLQHADRIRCPVIFFQGLDDRVVPPEQTERMALALQANGVPVEVHLFAGEGHGFRSGDVQKRVLEASELFFRRHFGL
ncbi:MAG: prolyl oligopeptidase family serine peptidase [Prochlorococcaceae cyanobacterium]